MGTQQKIMAGRKEVKVAIAQVSPYYLDTKKSLDVACAKIEEAGANGAELIVFSETWLGGYPYWDEGWNSNIDHVMDVRIKYYDNAVMIPGEETDRLCAAAKKAGAYVVMGVCEMDSRPNVHTMYNTLLYISKDGTVLGKHRKTVATYAERCFWGGGDGSDLFVYDTEIGRIGGLICGEHTITLLRARMIELGEDFHIAVYPGTYNFSVGPRSMEPDFDGQYCMTNILSSSHALEAGCFVLCSCSYLDPDKVPQDFAMKETFNADYAIGGSAILPPNAVPLVPRTFGPETIYATCQADSIKLRKAFSDTMGHYSRKDVVSLKYNYNPYQSLSMAYEQTPKEVLDQACDRYGIERSKLECLIEDILAEKLDEITPTDSF